MGDDDLLGANRLVPLLDELKVELQKLYGRYLKGIILYGSYARGNYDKESDVDIMVLVDLDSVGQREYRALLAERIVDISIKYDVLISVLDNNYEEFNFRASYVPFYRNVMQEGISVYAS